MQRGLEILGMSTGAVPPVDMITVMVRELLVLLSAGKLRIDIKRQPLSEVDHLPSAVVSLL